MIVLNELAFEAQFGENPPVVALVKEAALVAEDLGLDDPDFGDGGGDGDRGFRALSLSSLPS